jgi:hypothetical protein
VASAGDHVDKASCERALDYLLHRDRDNDGLVEMMTDSHREARGSDWIDIIWAAHENAFVNAQLFHALQLWAVARAGSEAPLRQRASDLAPNARYQLVVDNHLGATLTSDVRGELDLPLTSTTSRPTRFELRGAN